MTFMLKHEIQKNPDQRIVAVVGKAHLAGIKKRLQEPMERGQFMETMRIPQSNKTHTKVIVGSAVALLLLLLLLAFFFLRMIWRTIF